MSCACWILWWLLVNLVGDQGFTLLSRAAKCNACKCIAVLLHRGAGIDVPSRCAFDTGGALYECSPLFCAAEKGHIAACRLLMAGGASTNSGLDQAGQNCWPLLFIAVRAGSVEMCRLLLSGGALNEGYLAPERGNAVESFGNLARRIWPERHELAALMDGDADGLPPAPPSCANCLKSDGVRLKACGTCHAALYCCKKCQRSHWPQHKHTCVAPVDVYDAVEDRVQSILGRRGHDPV